MLPPRFNSASICDTTVLCWAAGMFISTRRSWTKSNEPVCKSGLRASPATILTLPRPRVGYHLDATHGVRVLPVDLPRRPWPVVMVSLKNRTTPPLVNLFIRRVRELARAIPSRVLHRRRRA